MMLTPRAIHCGPCDATVCVVHPADGSPGRLFEYEPDGFTLSPIQHICWPRDQRIGRLILARRELSASAAKVA